MHGLIHATPETQPGAGKSSNTSRRRLVDLYDECLSGLDADLGRFLGSLRSAGMLENTWVVITGDHGEHFGEHNQFGHGSSLYNELTHVPLILIPPLGPGESARDPARALRGRRIEAPVSLRDLPATVAGADRPGHGSPISRPEPGSLLEHRPAACSGRSGPVPARGTRPAWEGFSNRERDQSGLLDRRQSHPDRWPKPTPRAVSSCSMTHSSNTTWPSCRRNAHARPD